MWRNRANGLSLSKCRRQDTKNTASVRRCERIQETKAGTNPWGGWNLQAGKGRGRIQPPLGLEFCSRGDTKPKLHLRIRCCCFCLSLQPEAAQRKFYLIYARVAVMPVKPIVIRIQALCHRCTRRTWAKGAVKFKRFSRPSPTSLFSFSDCRESESPEREKNSGEDFYRLTAQTSRPC